MPTFVCQHETECQQAGTQQKRQKEGDWNLPGYDSLDGDEFITIKTVKDADGVPPTRSDVSGPTNTTTLSRYF